MDWRTSQNVSWPQRAPSAVGCETAVVGQVERRLPGQRLAFCQGTTWVGRHQKKHSPTHTHPDHRASFINFVHLLRSIASSLFRSRAWQSFSTTSLQVLFGHPLGFGPSTSYSMHFFTQSSSFRSTCPYHNCISYSAVNRRLIRQ